MTVKTIKATIRTPDGVKSIIYTYSVLELLKNDNNVEFIIDNSTGELLYMHES